MQANKQEGEGESREHAVKEITYRHRHLSNVRVDGAEREVLCGDVQLGQDVEEGTLSDVRESDNAHLHIVGWAAEVSSLGSLFLPSGSRIDDAKQIQKRKAHAAEVEIIWFSIRITRFTW